MYDPNRNDPTDPFPQLNDPSFWTEIASQVDVLDLTHENWQYPQYPQQARSPSPSYPRFESWQTNPQRGSRFLLPAPHVSSNMSNSVPMARSGQQARNERTGKSNTLWIALALLISIALFASVFGQRAHQPQQPQRSLTRINQWDPTQYNTPGDVGTWGPSACSAAAMTEYIDSFGHDYHIGDILTVEISTGQITSQSGLLNGYDSIETTVSHAPFNFQATQLINPSLDDVIAHANGGEPVIVGFPPATWDGGHILIVRGGNADKVDLVDSSRLNMPAMTRSTFLMYWRGFAVTMKPK